MNFVDKSLSINKNNKKIDNFLTTKIDKIKKVNTGVTTAADTAEKLATKAPKLIKQVGDVLGRVDAILNP